MTEGANEVGLPDSSGRCGSCRHWSQERMQEGWRARIRLKPLDGEDPYGDAIEERQRAAEARYGECQAIGLLDYYDATDAADVPVAFTKDASDYMASLYTRDDFGCTLWQQV